MLNSVSNSLARVQSVELCEKLPNLHKSIYKKYRVFTLSASCLLIVETGLYDKNLLKNVILNSGLNDHKTQCFQLKVKIYLQRTE